MIAGNRIKFSVFFEKKGLYLKSNSWFQVKKEIGKKFKKKSSIGIAQRKSLIGWDGVIGRLSKRT